MSRIILWSLKVALFSFMLNINSLSYALEGNFYSGNEVMKKGDYEEANRIFKMCQQDKRCILGAATTSRLIGNNSEAIKYYTELLNIDPEIEEGYFGRALAYRSLEEYNMAINDFKIALAKKDGEYTYAGLGDLYILTGKKDLGRAVLEEGLSKYPNSKLIRGLIVRTYN